MCHCEHRRCVAIRSFTLREKQCRAEACSRRPCTNHRCLRREQAPALHYFCVLKTQRNNPWRFHLTTVECQGLFRWIFGFNHWVTSLSADFSTQASFWLCFRSQAKITSNFIFKFLGVSHIFIGRSKPHLLGSFTCTLVSPLCVYKIPQKFPLRKMADFLKINRRFCEKWRK